MESKKNSLNPWIPIALAGVFFLFAWASYQQRLVSGLPPMFWFAQGIILGTFLVYGTGTWPYFLVSSLLLNFSRGFPWFTAPILTLGHLFGPMLGTFLFRRFAGPRAHLGSLRNVILFFMLTLGVGIFVGAGIEMLAVALTPNRSLGAFLPNWLDWWLDESLGALVIVPAWLALVHDRGYIKKQFSRWHFRALPFFLACLFIALNSYTPLASYTSTWLVRPYLLFPFILWAAIRYGILGASVVMQLTAMAVIIGLLSGSFPPASNMDPLDQVLLHECVLAALGATGLIIAATLREKDEALDTRDTFLSIASHELKTPLTSLKLQTDLTRRTLTASELVASERTRKFLEQSEKQIGRLTRLVDDMLDTSRIDTGKLSLRAERFDLYQLLHELLPRLAPTLQEAGCSIKLAADVAIVGNWDRFRLEQALTNLLTNSARYGAGKPVEIRAKVDGKYAEVRVRDHGRGIAKDDQARIFQRFERVLPNDVSGLGIGLFITKQLVELHGGTITVESELGQGAEFTIRLPLG